MTKTVTTDVATYKKRKKKIVTFLYLLWILANYNE